MAGKYKQVAVELTAPTGKLDRDMKRGVGIVRKRSRDASRAANKAMTKGDARRAGGSPMGAAMSGMRGRLGGMSRGMLAFGGFYGLQEQLRTAVDFEKVLVDVAVQGRKTKRWIGEFRKEILKQSNATGIAKEGYAAFVKQFAKFTGDVPTAVDSMELAAKVAKAAKVPMSDMANLIATLQLKAKVGKKDLAEAFDVIAGQAEKGAVELEDMASKFPLVLNTMQMFKHEGVDALKQYGAVFQIARRGNVSVERTATSFAAVFRQIAAKRTQIEKALNIKLKKDGAWLQLNEMLPLIFDRLVEIEKTGKSISVGKSGKKLDVTAFLGTMFGEEGVRAATPLLGLARNRWQDVGSEAGWGTLTGGGGGAIDRMLATRKKLSPVEDFNKSLTRLKNKMHVHMLPVIKRLGDVMEPMAKAAILLLDNWKLILGLWTGAKMAAFFRQLLQVGRSAGGGPGAALGGGGRGGRGRRGTKWGSRGRRAAGGAVAAIPLVSWAVEKGIGIGEYFAGTTLEEQRRVREEVFNSKLNKRKRKFGQKHMGKFEYVATLDFEEYKNTAEYRKVKGAAVSVIKRFGGDKGEMDLSRLADMTPVERSHQADVISAAKRTLHGKARQAVAKTGYAKYSTFDSFEAMVNRLTPAIEGLTQVQLKLETAIAGFNATEALVKVAEQVQLNAVNASRAGSK